MMNRENKGYEMKSEEALKNQNYFECAKSWADDIYTEMIASRNRYRFAFLGMAVIVILLVIALITVLPLKRTALVVVHQYDDGNVWVHPSVQHYRPTNKLQVEAEIVRYIVNRESYSAFAYPHQYSLVMLLSDHNVAHDYALQQSVSNQHSFVNRFGRVVIRKVHVNNLIFLDRLDLRKNRNAKQVHRNLAEVNFRVTDHHKNNGQSVSKTYTVLISWKYNGVPDNPEDQWRNWDGFTVTRYEVEQNNVNASKGATL